MKEHDYNSVYVRAEKWAAIYVLHAPQQWEEMSPVPISIDLHA